MLVIVSDFHLSEGWRKSSKELSPNEDFFFDRSFQRFLAQLELESPGNVHLVLNGDTFDFLQVVRTAEDSNRRVSDKIDMHEYKYGKKTTKEDSLAKIKTIRKGHGVFFTSLKEFLEKGNRLTVITGNHDIELYWPGVQTYFQEAVNETDPDKIEFAQWFFYDPIHKVYVEHGSQYEQFNSFLHLLYPLLENEEEINLPMGSFFVRYFFNQIESEYPCAENMKPFTKSIAWLFEKYKYRPVRLAILVYYILFTVVMTGKKSGGWFKPSSPENAKGKIEGDLKHIVRNINKKLKKARTAKRIDKDSLEAIMSLQEKPVNNTRLKYLAKIYKVILALPYAAFVILLIWTLLVSLLGNQTAMGLVTFLGLAGFLYLTGRVFSFVTRILVKDTSEYAAEIARGLNRNYRLVDHIVFGHTHEPDIVMHDKVVDYVNKASGNRRRFINLDEGTTYFNTGTWDVIFSEEEELIRDKMQFACLVFKNRVAKPVLKRWSDAIDDTEPLPLFDKEAKLSDRNLLRLATLHERFRKNRIVSYLLVSIMRFILLYKGHHRQVNLDKSSVKS